GRQREIAVRAAIGAARGRIARQVLTESLLLSLAAGGIGILIGRAALRLLIAIAGSGIPRLEHATLDRTVLLFTLAVSIGTGLLFGLLPALHLSRAGLLQMLREGSRGAGTRSRTRQALVVAEVAIALVLLVSAGLLARSFQGLQRVGGGFYLGRGFIRPGLSHPVEGYSAGFQIVTPGYFKTLGMPMLAGRDFDARDTTASPQVVVINRTVAARFFAGENPIGQKVLVWKDEKTPREIVGVVGDLKSNDLAAAAGAEMFVPDTQSEVDDMTLVVRTDGAPAASAAAVKAAVEGVDRTQAVYDVKTFDSIMS